MFGEASGQREVSGSLSPLRDSPCGWRVERGLRGGRGAVRPKGAGRTYVGRGGIGLDFVFNAPSGGHVGNPIQNLGNFQGLGGRGLQVRLIISGTTHSKWRTGCGRHVGQHPGWTSGVLLPCSYPIIFRYKMKGWGF